uniref:Uncharacterized protein n=1 Tax=Romanomermis culicivorax TaxID=13658 RepID=A0A915HUH9_ROMCU
MGNQHANQRIGQPAAQKHFHRDGAPQRDKNDNSTNCLERRAKGPGTRLLTASSGRPTRDPA